MQTLPYSLAPLALAPRVPMLPGFLPHAVPCGRTARPYPTVKQGRSIRRPWFDRSSAIVTARRNAMATADGAAVVRALAGRATAGDGPLVCSAIRSMAPSTDTLLRHYVASTPYAKARWQDAADDGGAWHHETPDPYGPTASAVVSRAWEAYSLRSIAPADLRNYLRATAKSVRAQERRIGGAIGGALDARKADDGKELARRKDGIRLAVTHRLRAELAELIAADATLATIAAELAADGSTARPDAYRQRLHRARAALIEQTRAAAVAPTVVRITTH